MVAFLALEGPRFAVFVVRETFFETGVFKCTLRVGRALRAAGFFAELFFLVGFAIAFQSAPLIDWRGENGRLIKNISQTAQADSVKKRNYCFLSVAFGSTLRAFRGRSSNLGTGARVAPQGKFPEAAREEKNDARRSDQMQHQPPGLSQRLDQ